MTIPAQTDTPPAVPRSSGRIVAMSAVLALLVCAALQIWRPYFFLTDDNLTQWLPPMVEMARNLHAGKPVFVSASLFGGNYDWSHDATIFPFISPLLPLLSPLAQSSYYFVLVDVIATFEFVVIAASFAGAVLWLRRRHNLEIGDWAIVALSLSYAFAPLHLIYGSSWMGFVNAQAAWPLVYVALQFSSPLRSVGLLFGAYAFALFGGNLHPLGFLLFGSGAWAAYFSWQRKSWRPLLCLFAALALLGLVAFLVIGPGLGEIATTGRIRAFSAEKASRLNISPLALLASFFLGPLAGPYGGPDFLFNVGTLWKAAVAFSAVNLGAAVMVAAGGWKNPRSKPILVGVGVTILFICRPLWLAELVAVTPVLGATRWPLRESAVLVFFAHLLFVLNYSALPRRARQVLCAIGILPLLLLLAGNPPSLKPLDLSRRLLISGVADEYWQAIRPTLDDRPNVMCIERRIVDEEAERLPYPLLPTHNLAALFGVVTASGYSTSTPLLLDRSRLLPPSVSGIYTPEQAQIYLEHFPNARLTVLDQFNPPAWSIIEGGRVRRMTIDPGTLVIRAVPLE